MSLLCAMAVDASAQSVAPSSPSKEYIYFGGMLIAIEERGSGGTAAVKTSGTTTQTASTSNTATTTPPIQMPTLPGPGTQASTAPKGPVANFQTSTPAATHAAK